MTFLLYLILGALAGTMAGLFGIGGGLIIVPVLIYSFEAQGLPQEILTHLAVGTSLATIVITSISSVKTHHSKGAVHWGVFAILAIGIMAGSWVGVYTAIKLPGTTLQKLIGIFAVLVAIKMWFGFKATESGRIPGKPALVVAGSIIGWVSSIFGIGGGTLSVPFLRKASLNMAQAVGTSAACGLPIAITGASANMMMGQTNHLLPALSTGYVYWPAFLGIVLTSVLFARFGALMAHKLSADKLQKSFSLLLLVVGCEFLLSF